MFSRLVNIAVGVIMVLGGISQFFPFGVGTLVVGIYVIIFGLSMKNHSMELKTHANRFDSCGRSRVPSPDPGLRLPLRFVPFLVPWTWWL